MSRLHLYFMVSLLYLVYIYSTTVKSCTLNHQKVCFLLDLSFHFFFLISFSSTISFPTLSHSPITPLLTLDEVQFSEEFEFFGDIQLEMSEGWIGSQSEMLEILNCFTEPGTGEKQGK